MGKREEIIERAYQHLGEDYYSLNYSAPDGYGGEGTHYVGAGWGCAQFVACCYNTTIGTRYVGSVYNYAGDALGQGVSQGGDEWYFVDDPEPGDAVVYIASGHNGLDYDDYGHIALYVGDGMVVGAMGRGTPGEARYLNIGISETSIAKQDIGGGWRFIRCTRLDEEQPEHKEQKTEENGKGMLACIISIDDDHSGYKKDMQVLWTPFGFEYINHPDSIKLLDEMSVYYTGKPIMRVHSGHDHPWAERLEQITIGDGAKTKGTVR